MPDTGVWTRKDLLGLEELSREEIEHILDTANGFKEISTRSIKKALTDQIRLLFPHCRLVAAQQDDLQTVVAHGHGVGIGGQPVGPADNLFHP